MAEAQTDGSSKPARLYEGLFLFNQASVASDFGGCVERLKDILNRAGADVVAMKKWEERRLAYDIRGQKRGTFILTYFYVPGVQIANIERDCELSEEILRAMMLRADHVGEVELDLAKKEADISLEAGLRGQEPGETEAQAQTVPAGGEEERGEEENA